MFLQVVYDLWDNSIVHTRQVRNAKEIGAPKCPPSSSPMECYSLVGQATGGWGGGRLDAFTPAKALTRSFKYCSRSLAAAMKESKWPAGRAFVAGGGLSSSALGGTTLTTMVGGGPAGWARGTAWASLALRAFTARAWALSLKILSPLGVHSTQHNVFQWCPSLHSRTSSINCSRPENGAGWVLLNCLMHLSGGTIRVNDYVGKAMILGPGNPIVGGLA